MSRLGSTASQLLLFGLAVCATGITETARESSFGQGWSHRSSGALADSGSPFSPLERRLESLKSDYAGGVLLRLQQEDDWGLTQPLQRFTGVWRPRQLLPPGQKSPRPRRGQPRRSKAPGDYAPSAKEFARRGGDTPFDARRRGDTEGENGRRRGEKENENAQEVVEPVIKVSKATVPTINEADTNTSPSKLVRIARLLKPQGDYPTFGAVPPTSFSCDDKLLGYYADPEAYCQVFHMCQHVRQRHSFLCPNGTLFNQQLLTCDHWRNVDCRRATKHYGVNKKLYGIQKKEPFKPKRQTYQHQASTPRPSTRWLPETTSLSYRPITSSYVTVPSSSHGQSPDRRRSASHRIPPITR